MSLNQSKHDLTDEEKVKASISGVDVVPEVETAKDGKNLGPEETLDQKNNKSEKDIKKVSLDDIREIETILSGHETKSGVSLPDYIGNTTAYYDWDGAIVRNTVFYGKPVFWGDDKLPIDEKHLDIVKEGIIGSIETYSGGKYLEPLGDPESYVKDFDSSYDSINIDVVPIGTLVCQEGEPREEVLEDYRSLVKRIKNVSEILHPKKVNQEVEKYRSQKS